MYILVKENVEKATDSKEKTERLIKKGYKLLKEPTGSKKEKKQSGGGENGTD